MTHRYNGYLKLANRLLYVLSAALLVSAMILSVAITPAQATTGGSDYQLNLSHIECVNNQVEVHFVLLNVPDSTTPGNLTFSVKLNGGSPNTYIVVPGAHTGNVWHYSWYGSVNGKYDVTSAYVWVNSTKVYLHNPDSYSDDYKNCVVATATATTVPTSTHMPPTATSTSLPTATATSLPTFTATSLPTFTATATYIPTATATDVPPTATDVPPTATATDVPPTATATDVLPTATDVPPTATATDLPKPTETQVEPTPTNSEPTPGGENPTPTTVEPSTTPVEPTATVMEPTPTSVDPTPTSVEPTVVVPTPTNVGPTSTPVVPVTPTPNPPPAVLDPVSLEIDPVCTVDGRMQWILVNPNSKNFTVESYTVDGGDHQPGLSVPPGKHNFITTTSGTHTVTVFYGESQSVSLTSTIDVCPLPVPVTGGNVLIPVTGADVSGNLVNGLFFGSSTLAGLGLLLTALRKLLKL